MERLNTCSVTRDLSSMPSGGRVEALEQEGGFLGELGMRAEDLGEGGSSELEGAEIDG